jgi:hypothetical protein
VIKTHRGICFVAAGTFCPLFYTAAQNVAYPRQPLGIYARDTAGCNPAKNQTMDQCITARASALLSNPAISGINAELNWSDLNPSMGTYAWNELDDLFAAIDARNQANPTLPPKTLQLDVNAGFQTPQWKYR